MLYSDIIKNTYYAGVFSRMDELVLRERTISDQTGKPDDTQRENGSNLQDRTDKEDCRKVKISLASAKRIIILIL